MAYSQIPNLPAAINLNGTEELEAVQSGTTVRVTTQQIASLGVLQLTTAQRNALVSPSDGMIIYNTTTAKFQGRANGSWVDFH